MDFVLLYGKIRSNSISTHIRADCGDLRWPQQQRAFNHGRAVLYCP